MRIMNNSMDQVISFVREKNGHKVLSFFNLSTKTVDVRFSTTLDKGTYKDFSTNNEVTLTEEFVLLMKPWEYLILHHSENASS